MVLEVKIACMHESAIQTEEMGGSIPLFCSCHDVVACGERIHWYDRMCLRWVDTDQLGA